MERGPLSCMIWDDITVSHCDVRGGLALLLPQLKYEVKAVRLPADKLERTAPVYTCPDPYIP